MSVTQLQSRRSAGTRFEPAPLPPRRPTALPPVRIQPEDLQDPFPDFEGPIDESVLAAARRAHPAGHTRPRSTVGPPRLAPTMYARSTPPVQDRFAPAPYVGLGATAPALRPEPRRAPRVLPLPEARPNLRVVRRRSVRERRRQRTMLTAALIATVCVAIAFFGSVALHAKLAQGQVRLDELQRSMTEQEKQRTVLRSEVARLESPERIVAAARDLGLVVPDAIHFVANASFDPAP